MSSTTGAVLLLVAGLGSMGYVTYRAVSSADHSAREVRELLNQDREPVHVRFVTHESVDDLKKVLTELQVPYRPEAIATKVALSETSCEVHVLVRPGDPKPSDAFITIQVSACRDMVTEFNGKSVAY